MNREELWGVNNLILTPQGQICREVLFLTKSEFEYLFKVTLVEGVWYFHDQK
jgi:hypothetical protein